MIKVHIVESSQPKQAINSIPLGAITPENEKIHFQLSFQEDNDREYQAIRDKFKKFLDDIDPSHKQRLTGEIKKNLCKCPSFHQLMKDFSSFTAAAKGKYEAEPE